VAAGEVDRKKADETLSSSLLWKQLLVVKVQAGEDQLALKLLSIMTFAHLHQNLYTLHLAFGSTMLENMKLSFAKHKRRFRKLKFQSSARL
jgi:hypothetical protein